MKIFLNLFAFLFIGLGFIGIFLPLIPTTPFLLLASTIFFRTSKKFHKWLINHKIFGVFIKNYIKHKAIPLKAKIAAIFSIWLTLPLSVFIFVPIFFVQLSIIMIGLIVSIKIFSIPTLDKNKNI